MAFLVALLSFSHTFSLEVSWTQYSDRAALPQSLRAREELREQLGRVNSERLSPAEKIRLRQLKRLLNEVIAESLAPSLDEAGILGILRLPVPGDVVKQLSQERVACLVLLLVTAVSFPGLASLLQARRATTVAAGLAEKIVEEERTENLSFAASSVACGEVFPTDVAQVLCRRIASVARGRGATKPVRDGKLHALEMDTQQLAASLAHHYGWPQVLANSAARNSLGAFLIFILCSCLQHR